jgi:epoxyqueuosine reductase
MRNMLHVAASVVDALRAFARARGAADLRIAAAAPPPNERARFAAAVARGDLATWPYDDAYATAATTPAALLAGARSVVCVALPYARHALPERPGCGRVSIYAASTDYHHAMHALLAQLADELARLVPGARSRAACDTAPIAERAFARASGLAWIGKHTNAIVAGTGSYAFLGELITDAALPCDEPRKTHCGSCSRCVSACPTGALRGDYTMDATRCIADLTQRTDAIPRALRPLVGTWVWGCDLCQAACPPTQRAPRDASALAPLPDDTARPPLQALLHLRSGAFKRTFARTAMGWRGSAVLRRNAAVALGNTGDRAAVPALEAALEHDPHPNVRAHAAWALGRIGSPRALRALATSLGTERDAAVCAEITVALEPRVLAGC